MSVWTMRDARRALDLERRGWTQEEIAGLLGRSRNSVAALLRRFRPARYPYGRLRGRDDELRRAWSAGACDAELARALGVAPATIALGRRRLGLTANPCAGRGLKGGAALGGGPARRDQSLANGLRLGWPGFTRREATILTELWLSGPADVIALAARLLLARVTVSDRLTRLRKAGAVRLIRGSYRGRPGLWEVVIEPCDTVRPRLEAMKFQSAPPVAQGGTHGRAPVEILPYHTLLAVAMSVK